MRLYKCLQGCYSLFEMLFFIALGVLSTLFFFHILGNQSFLKCYVLKDMNEPLMYFVTDQTQV